MSPGDRAVRLQPGPKWLAAMGLGALVLAGCTPLDRRWASQTGLDGRTPVALLEVDSRPAPPMGSLTLRDMSDQAAAAYIAAVAKFAKNPADLASVLAKPLPSAGEQSDRRLFPRVINLTVSKQGYAPADRIVQFRVRIVPHNFAVTGWTAAASEYTTQDIDKITITSTAKGQLEAKPTLSGATLGLTASGERSVENTATVTRRAETLTVSAAGGRLVVFRESERGFDLTGNTTIRLTVRPKDETPTAINTAEVNEVTATEFNVGHAGAWRTPAGATITLRTVRGLVPTSLWGTAHMEYSMRHVTAGGETYREDDDTVRFEPRCFQQRVVFVPSREAGLQSWGIQAGTSRVAIQADDGAQDLAFQDADAADLFAGWLNQTKASSIGGRALGLRPRTSTLGPMRPIRSTSSRFFTVPRTDAAQDDGDGGATVEAEPCPDDPH